MQTDLGHSTGAVELSESVREVEYSLRQLTACVPSKPGRVSWANGHSPLNFAVEELARSLQSLQSKLAGYDPENPLALIGERVADLAASLVAGIAGVDELEGARAVETTQRGSVLSLMPYDISQRFLSMLEARRCAWIFTSATLSVGEDFSHFTGRLGLSPMSRL